MSERSYIIKDDFDPILSNLESKNHFLDSALFNLLKLCPEIVDPFLHYTARRYFADAIFRNDLKREEITVIFKNINLDSNDLKNYCQISSTPWCQSVAKSNLLPD